MGFPQQAGYYLPAAAIPQPQRFFGQGQPVIRGGQPRWPQQGGRPQGQMMMAQNQFRQRVPNPRMNAGMQRPGGAPMMAPMMAARPGMPPQGMPQMPQVQPSVAGGAGVRANYKYTAGVRNVGGQVVQVTPQPAMPQTQAPQPAVFIQGKLLSKSYQKQPRSL